MEDILKIAGPLFILGIPGGLFILALQIEKHNKRSQETRQEKENMRKIQISKLKEMPISDLLKKYDLEKYCEAFEKNGVENLNIAAEIKDNDLINMGIEVLGDRIKLLKLFSSKYSIINPPKSKVVQKEVKMPLWGKICIILLTLGLAVAIYHIVNSQKSLEPVVSEMESDSGHGETINPLAFTTWRSANFRIDFGENTYTTERINNRHGTTLLQLTPRPYTVDGNTVTLENLLEMPFGSPMTRQGGSLISRTGERFTQE